LFLLALVGAIPIAVVILIVSALRRISARAGFSALGRMLLISLATAIAGLVASALLDVDDSGQQILEVVTGVVLTFLVVRRGGYKLDWWGWIFIVFLGPLGWFIALWRRSVQMRVIEVASPALTTQPIMVDPSHPTSPGMLTFPLNYPVTATFSLLSLGQTVRIADATGHEILFVRQKAFRLKTDVVVYADDTQTQPVFLIRGDRMIGSVKYQVTSADGRPIGSIQRQWGSFLWSATYRIFDANAVELGTIRQKNPWIRILHGLVADIPIVGVFAQMWVNPTYIVEVPATVPVMQLVKKRSFTSRRFVIEALGSLPRQSEEVVVPAIITFALMERARA
jgi:hypothetical protein